ncbi:c-type cytochrome [Pseudomonas stutzeri]|uniref:c-type cytochrome n=1 Tax=Stutzerimonas stutzeri TaxID=316 RepID=UPI000C6ACA61|nr:c-type cytochrome [Stutzerimonas stutzeri]MBK57412.1 cytochrome C [Pseudomonas sp.]MCQ4280570.1 c-type cytochrome [Stutzerimonas stutzeri]PNF72497.1 cytochrome C [Stutzerimonas stutzeri]
MPFQSAKRMVQRCSAPLRRWLYWLTGGSWKRVVAAVALLAALAGTGAFVLVSLGLVSISASSGHWKATGWMLHYAMRRAVSTQSMGIKVPPLDDPALLLKGAGHYHTGCLACHGAPGKERSLIVQQMTPEPPYLPPRIEHWAPQELFWIVKNGVKFTAMPAWPAQKRDDEVWAVVAFLQAMSDMSPERYKELALGGRRDETIKPITPDHLRPLQDSLGSVLANCNRCHAEDGGGRGEGAFPRLAGQSEPYLLGALQAYARGERHSGVMQPIAAGLEPEVLEALAQHYAELPPVSRTEAPEPAPDILAEGLTLAERGVRARGIPSCVHCHGPKDGPRNPMYPNIAGQYAPYLKLQLELFTEGKRGGTEYAHIMHSAAQRLTSEQMQALADYYASLPAAAAPLVTEATPNRAETPAQNSSTQQQR